VAEHTVEVLGSERASELRAQGAALNLDELLECIASRT
jgi:hypothetical protein